MPYQDYLPTRRMFLRTATLTTAGLLAGAATARFAVGQSKPDQEKPLYSFPLLGDLHFDDLAHHDLDWVRQEKPDDERQIANYTKITQTLTPGLFAGVSHAIHASAAPVPFVVQVGDLVEGLCGSHDLAVKQFGDAFAAVERADFGVPFLITKGNHDITGPGAPQAYQDTLMPWLQKQNREELADLKKANYVRRQDEDLFVFFDCYEPDLDWLEAVLTKHKARHRFVVVHQPVIPYNARSNWIVFARDSEADKRKRLLSLLGQYRAIVLGGHLHKYSLLTRATESGPIVQLAVCSVLRRAVETDRPLITGKERYGEALLDTEPKFAPKTIDQRRALLKAEAPSIEAFEYADLPGYAIVKVYADRVETDIFVGQSDERWKTGILRPSGQAVRS